MLVGEGGRQPRHPGRGLGLAVHHDEVPAMVATDARPASYGLGSEAAAGLGDVAQRGQVALLEPARSEELEGVRHTGEARRPGGGEEVPEALVDDATATARCSACASTSTPSRPQLRTDVDGTTRGWSPPTGPSTSSSHRARGSPCPRGDDPSLRHPRARRTASTWSPGCRSPAPARPTTPRSSPWPSSMRPPGGDTARPPRPGRLRPHPRPDRRHRGRHLRRPRR